MLNDLDALTGLANGKRLLFIGSGLSNSMKMPCWKCLLRTIITKEEYLTGKQKTGLLNLLAQDRKEYEVTDQLSEFIGRVRLEKTIIRLLQKKQKEVCEGIDYCDWASIIAKIKPTGIITTNWDTLLYKMFEYKQLFWRKPEDLHPFYEVLQRSDHFILYLHGNIDNCPLVITSEDCKNLNKELRNAAKGVKFSDVLADQMASYKIIILGYSFPDSHINEVLALTKNLVGPENSNLYIVRKENKGEVLSPTNLLIVPQPHVFEFKEYSDFKDTIKKVAEKCTTSHNLLLVRHIDKFLQLYECMSNLGYEYSTTAELRAELLKNNNLQRLLNEGADFVAQNDRNSLEIAGIMTTMLATIGKKWHPENRLLTKLQEVCRDILGADDDYSGLLKPIAGVIEPLVFALAEKGFPEAHKNYLHAIIENREWRKADFLRTFNYYDANPFKHIKAIARHINERKKGGYFLANDVTRLLTLYRNTLDKNEKDRIRPLLKKSNKALRDIGETKYAQKIQDEMKKTFKESPLPSVEDFY